MNNRKLAILGILTVAGILVSTLAVHYWLLPVQAPVAGTSSVVIPICESNGNAGSPTSILPCMYTFGGLNQPLMIWGWATNSPPGPPFTARLVQLSFVCRTTFTPTTITVSLNNILFSFPTNAAFLGSPSTSGSTITLANSANGECWFVIRTVNAAIVSSVTNGANTLAVNVTSGSIDFNGITAVVQF